MWKSLRKQYLLAILLLIPFFVAITSFYAYAHNLLRNNRDRYFIVETELLAERIDSFFYDIGDMLTYVGTYIEESDDLSQLEVYMQEIHDQSNVIQSFYILTKDNQMLVNTSGFIPPPEFDFRTRTWYIKAIEEEDIYYSDAFVNFTQDRKIVTISRAVYRNDELYGVIACDIDILSISKYISSEIIGTSGFAIVLDAEKKVLAYPDLDLDDFTFIYSNQVSKDLDRLDLNQQKQKIEIDQVEGYIFYQSVVSDHYIMGVFIPINEYRFEMRLLLLFFVSIIFVLTAFFALMFAFYKKMIVEPVGTLKKDIENIILNNHSNYRLPKKDRDPFETVRNIINKVLAEKQEALETIEKQLAEVKYYAHYDPLTNLKNCYSFETELERIQNQKDVQVGLMIIDINGLKIINDSFGHKAGDKIIQKTAKILNDVFMDFDIYRIGGDEFIVLFSNTSSDIVELLKQKAIEQTKILQYNNIQVSLSFGYELRESIQISMEEIQKIAENYMYRSKMMNRTTSRGQSIDAIIQTLYEKSPREQAHALRVASYCKDMAKAMQFSEERVTEIGVAGMLHDIGKIAIEAAILNKPGKLDQNEWLEIKRHPEIGYNILNSVDELKNVAYWILCHHERLDGTGYPRGVLDKQIPIEAKIISVADAFDAMTKDRPYQKELEISEAIAQLQKFNITYQEVPPL
jgi:diguanylate cyclase (GGDEF)-like protein